MLKQLFSNLLENSLRYTDKGGKVLITSAIHENEKLSIAFEDSAPAVPADLYDKLFERFFRVDSSRSRLLGGTGLGLAICKNIVESHDGGISAGPSSLGGLKIELWLPLDRSAGNE
ncbi:MAG: ATP-binding protein [Cyanobacteriota/Melainabacteria group bacterium]